MPHKPFSVTFLLSWCLLEAFLLIGSVGYSLLPTVVKAGTHTTTPKPRIQPEIDISSDNPLNTRTRYEMLDCYLYMDTDQYHYLKNYHRLYPELPQVLLDLGQATICHGQLEEGLNYIKSAVEKDHIPAVFLMAHGYKTKYTFKNHYVTDDPVSLGLAIQHFEKLLELMVSSNYPNTSNYIYEQNYYISVQSIENLISMYYIAYGNTLYKVVKNNVHSQNQTLPLLHKMLHTARICKTLPPINIWGEHKTYVYNYQQAVCDTGLNLAETIIPIETKRIENMKQCLLNRINDDERAEHCRQHRDKLQTIVDISHDPAFNLRTKYKTLPYNNRSFYNNTNNNKVYGK